MELGFLALFVVSVAIGLLLRPKANPRVGQVLLTIGLCAMGMAFAILALTLAGRAPFGVWTAGLASVILLVVGAAALPIGLTWKWGR